MGQIHGGIGYSIGLGNKGSVLLNAPPKKNRASIQSIQANETIHQNLRLTHNHIKITLITTTIFFPVISGH